MYRILFITDDWAGKKPLKSALLERGFSVVPVASADVFKEEFAPEKLDLLLVDLERCATEHSKLCHALRRESTLKEFPLVLLVTEEQLGHLEVAWGFDDYLTLPVTGKRLAERLHFLMWKLHKVELKNGFSHGALVIDFERYEVHVKGEPVDLTYKEFELLKFLATHPGKVFTREVLLDKVWGYDYYGGTRTVDVHIRRLRSKIESRGTTYIDTVRNVGYKFLEPEKMSDRRQGMTILETLLGGALLVIGGAALLLSLNAAALHTEYLSQQQIALNAAQGLLEEWMARPTSALRTAPAWQPFPLTQLPPQANGQLVLQIRPVPDGSDPATAALFDLHVAACWQHRGRIIGEAGCQDGPDANWWVDSPVMVSTRVAQR